MCRMSANSTFLVDKQPPGYSSKLDELAEMLDQLLRENDRKVLLFSEWTTMLNLVEPVLAEQNVNYVRLEVLIGKQPDVAMDESQKNVVEEEAERLAGKERAALAGGKMVSAAFNFLGEMFPREDASEEYIKTAKAFKQKLSEGMERAEDGSLKMTISFPDEKALDDLANTMVRMIGSAKIE